MAYIKHIRCNSYKILPKVLAEKEHLYNKLNCEERI